MERKIITLNDGRTFKLNNRPHVHNPKDKIFEREIGTHNLTISIKDKILKDGWLIQNQKNEGDCGGYMGKEITEMEAILQGKPYIQLSAQFMYTVAKMVMGVPINEDSGVDNRSLFTAKRKYGVCTEQLFPSNPDTMGQSLTDQQTADALTRKDQWFYNIKTIEGMAKCLSMGFVPGLGIELFAAFMNIGSDGIVPLPNGDSIGSHDQPIVTVDFENQFIECANSWDVTFGDKGFEKFPFAYFSMCNWDSWTGFNN
jgi:hypothetical protein